MGSAKLDLSRPPRLAEAALARLDKLTSDQVEQNAAADADNPPLSDGELDRVRVARFVQAVRKSRGMSQSSFARTYGIPLQRLQDWERGRLTPDVMASAYLNMIGHDPDAVARALKRPARA